MWKDLLALVKSVIKANGKGAITGSNLQEVVNTIITSLGENATYKGLADPSTIPSTEDGPVFYLAVEGGNYEYFDKNIFLPDGISIIKSNEDSIGGKYWDGVNLLAIDETISKNGEGLVRAKLIYSGFRSLGLYNYQEFDIWKTYGVGTKLLYNGELIEITKEHSPGELTEFEYKPATVDNGSGGGSIHADWAETDSNKPSFIENKPLIPKVVPDSHIDIDMYGNIDIDNNVPVVDEQTETDSSEEIYLFFDKTINKANEVIELMKKSIMELGAWKTSLESHVNDLSNQVNEAKGGAGTLGERLADIDKNISDRIPYTDIRSESTVNWESEQEVVSPKAINKHIADRVAELMTGRVTLKGKWSSISGEGNLDILPGYQYVYDRGNMPVGLQLEPGDILIAINSISVPSERDNKDNWIVAQGNTDYANLEGRVNLLIKEVTDARGGESYLLYKLNATDSDIANVKAEVKEARGGKISLPERLSGMEDRMLSLEENGLEIEETNNIFEILN